MKNYTPNIKHYNNINKIIIEPILRCTKLSQQGQIQLGADIWELGRRGVFNNTHKKVCALIFKQAEENLDNIKKYNMNPKDYAREVPRRDVDNIADDLEDYIQLVFNQQSRDYLEVILKSLAPSKANAYNLMTYFQEYDEIYPMFHNILFLK